MLNLLGKIKLKYVGRELKNYALAWTELRPRRIVKRLLIFAVHIKLKLSVVFYFYFCFCVSIQSIQIILTSGTMVKPGHRAYNLKGVERLNERLAIEK